MNVIKANLNASPNEDLVKPGDIQREQAREALRRSFEHGAPETGPGDELDIRTDADQSKD